jgi:hypothetical protein
MKRQFSKSLGAVLLAWVVALPLVSCSKNEKQKAEIESLRQEILDRDANIAALESRSAELNQKNSELDGKARDAEQKAGQLENQLTETKNELAAMQKPKAAEVAQAPTQTPSQIRETTKTQLGKQLPAILLIEGDVSSGRGSVIQADGKTWLYSAAQLFSGNSKFTIKGADGAALTKLGGFQVAADANLVRLEIQQEMSVKLELDGKAAVAATTPLLAVSAGPNETALQILEYRITRTDGNDFDLEANTIPSSYGCPLLSAESGKVIAIFSSGSTGAAPTLWPNAQQATGAESRTRAARLNRTIEWKPTTIAGFLGERHKIDDMNKITRLLHALAAMRVAGESLQLDATLDGGNTTANKVLAENAALPMVTELMKIQTDLTGKKMGMAARDIKRRLVSVLGQAKNASSRQVQEMKVIVFSSYHRSLAELALKWRAEADQAVNATLDTLSR